jgi:hypothetical protein
MQNGHYILSRSYNGDKFFLSKESSYILLLENTFPFLNYTLYNLNVSVLFFITSLMKLIYLHDFISSKKIICLCNKHMTDIIIFRINK